MSPGAGPVALFVPTLRCGGAEKNIVKLANGLARRGHRVSLLVVEGGGELEGLVDAAVERVELLPRRRAAALAAFPPCAPGGPDRAHRMAAPRGGRRRSCRCSTTRSC